MDWRVLVVLGPIIMVAGWAAYNIYKDVQAGNTKIFGDQGNLPWQDK